MNRMVGVCESLKQESEWKSYKERLDTPTCCWTLLEMLVFHPNSLDWTNIGLQFLSAK